MKAIIAAALASFALSGCDTNVDVQMRISPQTNTFESRVTVTRIGIFEDGLAYGSKRGIYIIQDTKTGQEFVGVSGIGISELGGHHVGKQFHNDER